MFGICELKGSGAAARSGFCRDKSQRCCDLSGRRLRRAGELRCAERTQACRCESKGSHYYCQKEPSSLLKVWRVLLLQSTHKSTQLQNLRENALNIFCRLFESAFTLVLIPTSMLSEGPIICFGKSSGSSVFTRLTVAWLSSGIQFLIYIAPFLRFLN